MDERLEKLIQQIEQQNRKHEARMLAARQKEKERLDAIERLRHERQQELRGYASQVVAWHEAFRSSETFKRLQTLGYAELPIFSAKYQNGEPAPKGDRRCHAEIFLMTRVNGLMYRESYSSSVGSSDRASKTLTGPESLYLYLHPDFLKELAAHLSGPDPLSVLCYFLETHLLR